MGLCPSRNKAVKAQTYTPQTSPSPAAHVPLRADAAAFVPEQPAREPWEQFLEQKQREQHGAFVRKVDGSFTHDYRRLLDEKKAAPVAKYVPPQQRNHDWIQEWKDAKKPQKPPAKPAPAPPALDSDAKLKQALLKVKELSPARDAVLAQLAQLEEHAKDDAQVPSSLVPFGLTDLHYQSDGEAPGCRHACAKKLKPKTYCKSARISRELERCMTNVLYSLKVLRTAETKADLPVRRFCVGLREVARALRDPQCALKAVLVAPDVDADSKTAKGSLDEKLRELVAAAKTQRIPVIYGLSRVRLGQAVKKSVTISVLGVLNVRGLQETFDELLRCPR